MVLSHYATGVISRGQAMDYLVMNWYGDLVDAMAEAGLTIELSEEFLQSMQESLNAVFDGLGRKD